MSNVARRRGVKIPGMYAALFANTPEGTLLDRALHGLPRPEMLAGRTELLSQLRATPGSAVLLPSHTADGAAIAPFVRECHRVDPAAMLTVVLARQFELPRGVRRAVCAGAQVESVRTAGEMRVLLRALARAGGLTVEEWHQARGVIRRVVPPPLRPFMQRALLDATERRTVTEVAELAGNSFRTIERVAERHDTSPSELQSWARLLRAAVIAPRVGQDASLLARATRFPSFVAFEHAVTTLGVRATPLVTREVSAALRWRLRSR